MRLRCEETGLQKTFRNRSLFITWEGGSEDFGGDHLIFRRTGGGGGLVNESPKGGDH